MIERCNVCGGNDVVYESNDIVFGVQIGDNPYIYFCQDCGAYVGVHRGTRKPLGTLADAKTRKARQDAHTVFDSLWTGKNMRRKDAYAWLAEQMDMDVDDCHIGAFDFKQCEQVIRIVMERLSE